jgi:hypothetical protein
MAACAPFVDATRPDLPTPTPEQAAPSATLIVWFPPTETATIAPATSVRPTAERRPGIGELLVEDAMTSATHWNAASSGTASVTVSERGLSISAQPGGPPVISLHRSAVFDDMYMEITARPNLCRDTDSYGLVFRAPNDVANYRFMAGCDGTAAAERVSLGTPRVLQPPTATSDVPFGAPGEVRLGVWARGSEFRFFLNDHYQFTVTDKNYAAGRIGVFAAAMGNSPVVVTFTDLRVYRLQPMEFSTTPAP